MISPVTTETWSFFPEHHFWLISFKWQIYIQELKAFAATVYYLHKYEYTILLFAFSRNFNDSAIFFQEDEALITVLFALSKFLFISNVCLSE
jgi:hypothetical protein